MVVVVVAGVLVTTGGVVVVVVVELVGGLACDGVGVIVAAATVGVVVAVAVVSTTFRFLGCLGFLIIGISISRLIGRSNIVSCHVMSCHLHHITRHTTLNIVPLPLLQHVIIINIISTTYHSIN